MRVLQTRQVFPVYGTENGEGRSLNFTISVALWEQSEGVPCFKNQASFPEQMGLPQRPQLPYSLKWKHDHAYLKGYT